MNTNCDSVELLGREVAEVNERLRETEDFREMIKTGEGFLLKKVNSLKNPDRFDKVFAFSMAKAENLSVESMADRACLSFRQFERKCRERIGISPRVFIRLVRFSRAYRLHEQNPQLSWTSIAHVNGYFDQAHLIRDFKQFTGVSPGFLKEELTHTPLRLQGHFTF